jgi:hypothetical protein
VALTRRGLVNANVRFPIVEMVNVRSLILAAVVSYVAATVAAVATILLWTLNLETISVGLLGPIFMLPGLIAYMVASAIPRFGNWRTLLYWVLVSPWPLYVSPSHYFLRLAPARTGQTSWQLLSQFRLWRLASCVTLYCWSGTEADDACEWPIAAESDG